MRDIVLRLGKNEDGPRIGELVGLNFEVDWSDIEPWWVVAEIDGKVVGAVQVCPAKPVARVEMLAIDPELNHRARSEVVMRLRDQWEATARMGGAVALAGAIESEMQSFFDVAVHRGYRNTGDAFVMMKRV